MQCLAMSELQLGAPDVMQPLHFVFLGQPRHTCAQCVACCVGIIGGNGSGKSTLFKMMMGQEQPDSGEVALGQTVVPMYSEQSREGLSDNNTVRTTAASNPHPCCSGKMCQIITNLCTAVQIANHCKEA